MRKNPRLRDFRKSAESRAFGIPDKAQNPAPSEIPEKTGMKAEDVQFLVFPEPGEQVCVEQCCF
jgi:hypothetical protein